ncbi:hypothetical protein [Mitsuokella sp.]|uniref:hypothetical protein n=1 Tax=Mitsuokella sp. TaxID=2049034 RepID=UPI003D7EFDF8
MFKCSVCGRELSEKEALVHQGKNGEKEVICPACFEKIVGVDYETFRYRRENAKQTFFAVLFCLAATIYAFFEKGWPYAVLGIVLTLLVYFFSSRTGKPKTKKNTKA